MAFESHNLTEVLCAFWFDPEKNPWDSTFFGKFHEKIEGDYGFKIKQEQKNIQFQFLVPADPTKHVTAPKQQELDSRMIFRNEEKQYAVMMAPHYISFHKLSPYDSFEKMKEEIIDPLVPIYKELGLGKGLKQAQMLYINGYSFGEGANLSDTFQFLPAIDKIGIGTEKTLLFQAQYDLKPNILLQIKLTSVPVIPNPVGKNVFLECGAFATNIKGDEDWVALITQAHDTNNKVFNLITKKQ